MNPMPSPPQPLSKCLACQHDKLIHKVVYLLREFWSHPRGNFIDNQPYHQWKCEKCGFVHLYDNFTGA